jgi:hypothetical protein
MAGAERRLAAIWFSDIVGDTALVAADEAAGLRARARHRSLLRSLAARHGGVVPERPHAVACALGAQASLREDRELRLRIGIHLGDVILEGGRVYGDGVNVASRIRPLAEAGRVAVSEPVFDAVKGQAGLELAPLGTHALKNVERPLAIYAVMGTFETSGPARLGGPGIRRAVIGVALAAAAAGALYLARELRLSRPVMPASVAVLPFADMSEGGNREYFADGATAHMWRGQMLIQQRRVSEGSTELQLALELDRFSPVSPQSPRTRGFLRDAYAIAGREKDAAETLLAGVPPLAQAELRSAYEAGGLRALLERFLRFEQERTGQRCASPAGVGASLSAQLGDAEGVFRCLELAARTGDMSTQVQVNPLFAPYRSDSRYAAYLRAMNLSE